MPVTEQSPVNTYTANGSTTVFPFAFLVLNADDLVVTVDGDEIAQGIDYSIAGLGASDGGAVTLVIAPTNGQTVMVFRRSRLRRLRDYQTNGDLLADELDKDVDALWMALQEQYAGLFGSTPTPGDAVALRGELVNPNSDVQGAGLVAFNAARNYPANTIGAAIKALEGGTGSGAYASVFDFMSAAEIASVVARDNLVDVTAAIQAALDATANESLFFPAGIYKTTAQLTVSNAGVSLILDDNAVIQYVVASYVAIRFLGANCTLTGGAFVGLAAWDGANVLPTYGAVWISGDNFQARGVRLENIRKIGFWFKDVVDGSVQDCDIIGNYPTGSWTGVETGHFGVLLDPSAGTSGGNFTANGNRIKTCVQGVFGGNYGTGGRINGLNVAGNLFESCWNHGVYTATADGAVVTGNTFNRCQIPVACTGSYNTVTGNTMYTSVATAGDQRDLTGIQIRDSRGSVVTGNTIKGVVDPSASVLIDIINLDGSTAIEDNVVANNTIHVTAGSVTHAIRVEGNTVVSRNNRVTGNVIAAPGNTSNGLIAVGGAGGSSNNVVAGNTIRASNGLFGIVLANQQGSAVTDNLVEISFDAGGASVYSVVTLVSSSRCTVSDNITTCPAGFGANITAWGYRELTSASKHRVSRNIDQTDKTKLVGYVNVTPINSSEMLLDDAGVGAPLMHAQHGSRWVRTDGTGAAARVYVKESGITNSGWVPESQWGNYFPTFSAGTNITSNTPKLTRFFRVGQEVFVSGSIQIQATTAGSVFSFKLTLPTAAGFSFPSNDTVTGVFAGGQLDQSGIVRNEVADTANAIFEGIASSALAAAPHNLYFNFSYLLQV